MKIRGFLERIEPTQIRGWAQSLIELDAHVDISVFHSGALFVSGKANIFRDDLMRSGVGRGDHGFVINFEGALDERSLSTLSVEASMQGGPSIVLEFLEVADVDFAATLAAPLPASRDIKLANHAPIFVLGAARSGTSAMAQALLRCGDFKGFEEGHFLTLLPRLLSTLSLFYEENRDETKINRNTLLQRMPESAIGESIKDVFRNAIRLTFPDSRWLDKTPNLSTVAASPIFAEIWPDARFIFMKRRGLENILSRAKKFPTLSFEHHCLDWAAIMESWRMTRPLLGSNAVEIEQLDMAENPLDVSARVSSFLQLSSEARVRFSSALEVEQPERTSKNFRARASLEEIGWSESQISFFRNSCDGEMMAYGYSFDATYFMPK